MYKLDEQLIKGNPVKQSVRKALGHTLAELGAQHQDVVAVTADLASSVGLAEFKECHGARFIETGIAEQNLVTLASGLAHEGKTVYLAAYAAFSPGRNWEQIRTTICLNDQPVKVIGSHTGLNVGPDGATHQMLEDIALMRVLPNMTVLAPGDANEAAQMAQAVYDYPHPVYIRVPRSDQVVFSTPDDHFKIGKAYVVRQDDEAIITLLSTGTMTGTALLVAQALAERGVGVSVVHVPTIKPLDRETILREVGKNSVAVTLEEHQVAGGFGSAIAELLLESGVVPQVFKRIGVNDQFGQSGTADELLAHYGLDVAGVLRQITQLIGE